MALSSTSVFSFPKTYNSLPRKKKTLGSPMVRKMLRTVRPVRNRQDPSRIYGKSTALLCFICFKYCQFWCVVTRFGGARTAQLSHSFGDKKGATNFKIEAGFSTRLLDLWWILSIYLSIFIYLYLSICLPVYPLACSFGTFWRSERAFLKLAFRNARSDGSFFPITYGSLKSPIMKLQ